jgi:hypothetical protein
MNTWVQFVLILLIVTVSATGVAAQTVPSKTQEKPVINVPPRPNVDETFDLNIDLRQITRENFEASTSVSTDNDSGLDLQVGVGLVAGRIDVLLRNVRGRVRFRGSLDRILEMIDRRPVAPAAPAP